ncbi:hypothetical protein U3516DRAFT_651457 [Neocallimastix sp. 'constans']
MKHEKPLKYHIIIFIWINLINIIQICVGKKDIDKNNPEKFTIDLFNDNSEFISRYHYTYNYTTLFFNEYEEIKLIHDAKSAVICNSEDIDKGDDEKETVLFWTTPYSGKYYNMTSIFMSAFPIWYNEQKKQNKIFCLKFYDAGWDDNVNAEICKDEKPCPDMIMIGTTQLSYRYKNDETLNLEPYFRKYFKKTGKSIESLINKYSYYDYHLGNNWLAVPLIVDFRTFWFNITTFDYCIDQGYDLHYPPPISDYWGRNYHKTWTWEKVFEYAKKIKNCTGLPGLNFPRSNSYEAFIILCQSLGIPFITEDINSNVKKCGFRSEEYIKKLSIIIEPFENHYIDKWLKEDQVFKWLNSSSYPESFDTYPKLRMIDSIPNNDIQINGLGFGSPFKNLPGDILLSYMPGTSSFLGGAGIIITKMSKYPDQLFEYIEILINQDYPFFAELNSSITPFENIFGKKCIDVQKNKKELCNELLQFDEVTPYYYVYNNKMNVVFLNHITNGSNRGVSINLDYSSKYEFFDNKFLNINFQCDNEINFINHTITYSDKYKIEFPISENESIILKTMNDINYKLQSNDKICSIFDSTVKIAKPYQFPYSTFGEINDFENHNPISILLAHLYYKEYEKNPKTFKEIINECCDLIDHVFLPSCDNNKQILYNITDCNDTSQLMDITYLNCKTSNNTLKTIECSYIPYKNFKGIIIIMLITLTLIIEFIFLFIIIIAVLNTSVIFWIGKLNKYNCILKFWTLIVGITGFICSYCIKSEVINSVINTKNITKINKKYKSFLLFWVIGITQFILLLLWTFTQKGIEIGKKYYNYIGHYDYEKCSLGNVLILKLIFFIDYILIIISIIVAYRGRKVPSEFNDSKKILSASSVTFLLLTLCYILVFGDVEIAILYFIISLLILLISLFIIIIFVGEKILIVLNINIEPECSIIVETHKIDEIDKTVPFKIDSN